MDLTNIKKIFRTINSTPNLGKNWLVAIVIQLVMFACLFLPIIGLFIAILLLIYLLGYFLKTVQTNVEIEDFTLISWLDIKILKEGFRGILSILLFIVTLYAIILLFATICFIPLTIIAPMLDGGEYIGWIGVLIPMAITFYIVYPYLIITTPATIANYINKNEITAPLRVKETFILFKKDLKTSFKTFFCLIILLPLNLLPVLGYYFTLVSSKIITEYTKFIKTERK